MDILTKQGQVETKVPAALRTVKLYYVCVGSFAASHSRRAMSYAKARRTCARARRRGLDAYVSSPVLRKA